jgi:ketosteroid isomerase-like protein
MAALNVADLSVEQREIWQAEQDYWTLVREDDAEGMVALAHRRVTVWPEVASLPIDSVHFRDSQQQRTRFERDPIAAFELDFHSIEVHGDAAIVYYTVVVTSRVAPPDGTPAKRRSCITHIWIKDDGVWRLAGGMSRSPE